MRNTTRAWMGGAGLWLLLAGLSTSLGGCSKKTDEETKAKAEVTEKDDKKKKKQRPQGDRYADGKRLEASLKDWTKRWADTPELPACDPLLKKADEIELCKAAAAALTTMKAAAAKPEAEAVLLKNAADLAFATESASEKLRAASMEKMQAEHKAAPAGSVSPKANSSAIKVKPPASAFTPGAPPKPGDKLRAEPAPVDPSMQVMQAYSRVNRAALRYLSQYLQFGPLPTRQVAFTEVESLSKRKEAWPALGRTLREAAMAENDPDLQAKLKALAPKLSRRTGQPGAPALPLGHPPTPAPAAPPSEQK